MKVLFIYPTLYRITGLPVGLAVLSAVLKAKGHQVRIFDTCFYPDKKHGDQTIIRAARGMSKKVANEDVFLQDKIACLENDLINTIHDYEPDLVGISMVEMVYELGIQVTRCIKNNFRNLPVIAGGVFPTLSPEIIIQEDSIDIVCVGEGETALAELCNRLENNIEYTDINGLWVKTDKEIHKNEVSVLHNLDSLPYPDYTEFDEKLFYKPMQGAMYKMVNITTSRGCAYSCTFCSAPQMRNLLKKNGEVQYYRKRSMENIIKQIRFQREKHNPNFIYFSSESFLSLSKEEFDAFISEYKNIGLPFWFQTRIETVNASRIEALMKVGMKWLSIGLEHGNEEYRKRMLGRNYSNKMFIDKMRILRDLNIGASINNMIGFPHENKELVFDTINFNRELWLENPKLESNVFLFAPFRGCALYDVCKEENLLADEDIVCKSAKTFMSNESMLIFDPDFRKELEGIIKTFNLYVKLDEKYYDQIALAGTDSPEGKKVYQELRGLLSSGVPKSKQKVK